MKFIYGLCLTLSLFILLLAYISQVHSQDIGQNSPPATINPPKGDYEVLRGETPIKPFKAKYDRLWYRLWMCESSYMPDVVHLDSDGEYAKGPVQFHQKTFDSFGEKYGLPHDDILSPVQQRAIWERMYEDGYFYLWGCASIVN